MRVENRGKETCTCIVPCYNEEETVPQYYVLCSDEEDKEADGREAGVYPAVCGRWKQ